MFNRPKVEGIALASLPGVVSDMHENNNAGFTAEYEVSVMFIKMYLTHYHYYLSDNSTRQSSIVSVTRILRVKYGEESVQKYFTM